MATELSIALDLLRAHPHSYAIIKDHGIHIVIRNLEFIAPINTQFRPDNSIQIRLLNTLWQVAISVEGEKTLFFEAPKVGDALTAALGNGHCGCFGRKEGHSNCQTPSWFAQKFIQLGWASYQYDGSGWSLVVEEFEDFEEGEE